MTWSKQYTKFHPSDIIYIYNTNLYSAANGVKMKIIKYNNNNNKFISC